ncbi:MAG: transposase [Candidatus Pacebacteria bacterium]|nr:transposase [Candidatus Paceibacterota bacterium]
MPTPRINQENENIAHFLTITIIEWIDVFTKPQYFQIIIDSLKYCQKNKGLLLYEFVIMTNHLHLVAKAKEKYKLSQIISDFKKHTTREILKELEKDNRRYILNLIKNSFSKKKDYQNQIWQRENYSEVIESEKFYFQKAKYIYNNPIKREYVAKQEDWFYSSAKNRILNDNNTIELGNLFG